MQFKKIAILSIISLVILLSLILNFNENWTDNSETLAINSTKPANDQDIQKQKSLNNYGKLPLHFEQNLGQANEQIKFLSRGHGYNLFLTNNEAILALQNKTGKETKSSLINLKIEGANDSPKSIGLDETGGKSNYLIGNDPEKWQRNVPNFQKIKYESIYEGVDLVFYGNQRKLEYDFVVSPNTDPDKIKLNFSGVSNARIEKETGDLLLETEVGEVRQHKPFTYQMMDGEQKEIASNYKVETRESKVENPDGKEFIVSFKLADYDKSKELVIDPILAYGSYIGGNKTDIGKGIAVDGEGNAFIIGETISVNFPVTPGAFKTELLPRANSTSFFFYDAFVTKVNSDGTALVYSTYFGSNERGEQGNDIEVDAKGNAYIIGSAGSEGFPIVNADQPVSGGGGDAFIAKLNSTGSDLIFSTYLGGFTDDYATRLAVGTTGEIYVGGTTASSDFPTTVGVIKPAPCVPNCGVIQRDAFIAKYLSDGTKVWSTLFGGDGAEFLNDIAVDNSGNSYFVGRTPSALFPVTVGAYQTTYGGGTDGYITKINSDATQVIYASFLGGGAESDRANAVAVDANGNAYVGGQTENVGFPTTVGAFDRTINGGQDAFLTKFNADGTGLIFSTFLGGVGGENVYAVKLGQNDNIFVTGEGSTQFPLVNSLMGDIQLSGLNNIFLTKFNSDGGSLIFSTFLGRGGARDMAIDASDNAYLTGEAHNVPVTPNAFQRVKGDIPFSSVRDGFVMKIAPTDETQTFFSISGNTSDQSGSNTVPVIVIISGDVNRTYSLPFGNGGGRPYHFGGLPAGGNYTVTATKVGYSTNPESVVFNSLQANQTANFTIAFNTKPEGVVTSPQHQQVFDVGSDITIQATASDPDGHSIEQVKFLVFSHETGNFVLEIDTEAPYQTIWKNVPIGTWSIYALPTDELGLEGISIPTVHIQVVDPAPPTVSITSPTEGASFEEGDTVTLSADVSSSVTLLEFFDQNNTLIGRRTSSPWTTTKRFMNVGNYAITAKAYTTLGEEAVSKTVNIAINPINHMISGKVVDSLEFLPVAGVALNLTTSNPNITAQTTTNSKGEYSFTNLGTTINDSATIVASKEGFTFIPGENSFPLGYINPHENKNFTAVADNPISLEITSPTWNQTFVAPADINLIANASSSAGEITKVEYFYRINGGDEPILITTDTTAPYQSLWEDVGAGTYFIFAEATDSTGGFNRTSQVRVNVDSQAGTVRLQGRITDPNGNGVAGVSLNISDGIEQTAMTNLNGYYGFFNLPTGVDYRITPQPTTITFSPTSQSFTNVTQDIFDIDFNSSTANQPPTAQFNTPTDGQTFTMPVAIQINATASDPDGQVTHFRISASDNTRVMFIGETNNGNFNAPWEPPAPGEYTLIANPRDNSNLQTTTTINITVLPPPPVSISGRIVDRSSNGIPLVAINLENIETDEIVGTAVTDANGNYTISAIPTFVNYDLTAEKLNYSILPQRVRYFNLSENKTADFTGTVQLQPSDFDGDGGSDVAVWRPSNGVWHMNRSNDGYTSVQFGNESFGDVAVPGNYDGDSKMDIAVYRNGTWYIQQSSNNEVLVLQLGTATDKPVAGDYDGDGKTDIAVWRPSTGVWYIYRSSDGQYDIRLFGLDGDIPLIGDYDGDGKTELTIWRPSTGVWYVWKSTDYDYRIYQFGQNGDIPLVGDFDGDNQADYTIYRPETGVWYVNRSSDNTFTILTWGISTDIPVPGDFDKDGKTDFGVFRKSEGNWYIYNSVTGNYSIQKFGIAEDMPIPAAYN